jgi:ornithine cyclodeaminase/alanine dehydrogenase-like protein (mu-crystallin family)
MRLMAGALPTLGIFGYKEFHLSQDNSVRYAVHLFEIESGRPIGVVDAALVTTLRTAATAAVASQHFLGGAAAVRLGVIGTGAEALAGVRALANVLDLGSVRVTSRRAENRDKFAVTVAEETGLPVEAVADARSAAAGSDIVYVATASGGKVVVGAEDLAGVPFVASIGSTIPAQRELDADVLSGAGLVVVDTFDVLEESGDALAALDAGLQRDRVRLLGDWLGAPAAAVDSGPTVYKSIGSPEQDLVLAHAILRTAAERGFGRRMEPLSLVKRNL